MTFLTPFFQKAECNELVSIQLQTS